MAETRSKRPTMREVGALAGVSIKTVSRVVNGETTVAPELAARVHAAIAQLGYRPDHAASSLRRSDGRSRTLAVVLEDLANPFSAAVHRAVVDTARARGVLVLAASSDEDPVDEREAVAAFTARRVDGLVLMPTSADHGWLTDELADGTKMVMVDRPAGELADAVVSDNRASAERAVTHLLRRGHRRIAFLGDLHEIYTACERVAGYRAALAAAGLPEDERIVRFDLRDSDAAQQAVIELLDGPDPPTALFPSQNLLTIGAVRALRALGLHHEVALVGFDDIVLGELLDPGVTVVAQDPATIGRIAAEQVLRRIDGDTAPPAVHVVPTRLIPRGSGEITASR
jgi:LacI family transcriptional regulator